MNAQRFASVEPGHYTDVDPGRIGERFHDFFESRLVESEVDSGRTDPQLRQFLLLRLIEKEVHYRGRRRWWWRRRRNRPSSFLKADILLNRGGRLNRRGRRRHLERVL